MQLVLNWPSLAYVEQTATGK